MLTARRINETSEIKRKCIDDIMSRIQEEASLPEGRPVHVARFLALMAYKLFGHLILSRDLQVESKSEEGFELFTVMERVLERSNHPNIVDYFTWWRWLDLWGLRTRKLEYDVRIMMRIFSGFVKERMNERQVRGGAQKKDFLDTF